MNKTTTTQDNNRLALALKNANRWKQRAGKSFYLKHLKGETLTRNQAIKARCYECNGDSDTCEIVTCALLPFCQFNQTHENDTLESITGEG